MPCFAARLNIISGSSVPSMWRWSSTLGSRRIRPDLTVSIAASIAIRRLPYYLPLVGEVGTVANPMTDDATPETTGAAPSAPSHYDPVPAVARALGLAPGAVAAVVAMLDEGNTVPFIARYRKERTGGLDEVQIRAVEEQRT